MLKFIAGVITGVIACFILVKSFESRGVANKSALDNNSVSQVERQESTGVISKSESTKGSRNMELRNKELAAEVTELKGLLAKKEALKQSSPKLQIAQKQFYQQVPDSHRHVFNYENLGKSHQFKLLDSVHAEFVSEDKDQSWALAMEQQIESYIYQHRHSGLFQLRKVECKSTMCEIYASVLSHDNKYWEEAVKEMENQAWWENFHQVSVQKRNKQGGLIAYTAIDRK